MAVGGFGHHTYPYIGILSFSALLFLVLFLVLFFFFLFKSVYIEAEVG